MPGDRLPAFVDQPCAQGNRNAMLPDQTTESVVAEAAGQATMAEKLSNIMKPFEEGKETDGSAQGTA